METGGLTYNFETHSDYSVLVLKPSMNDSQWSEIEKAGDEVLRELEAIRTPHLIVDLSELEFIGSAMVALVVRIWKIVQAKKARMVVVNRNPMVLEVFKISRLDDVWNIQEYREDALYQLGVSQEAKSKERESGLLVWVTVLASLLGAIALGMHFLSPDLLGEKKNQIMAYGCAGLGILLGVLALFTTSGSRRVVGIGAAVLSAAVLVCSTIWMPLETKAAPNPPANNQPNEPNNSDTQPEDKDQSDSHQPAVAEKPARKSPEENEQE